MKKRYADASLKCSNCTCISWKTKVKGKKWECRVCGYIREGEQYAKDTTE